MTLEQTSLEGSHNNLLDEKKCSKRNILIVLLPKHLLHVRKKTTKFKFM